MATEYDIGCVIETLPEKSGGVERNMFGIVCNASIQV